MLGPHNRVSAAQEKEVNERVLHGFGRASVKTAWLRGDKPVLVLSAECINHAQRPCRAVRRRIDGAIVGAEEDAEARVGGKLAQVGSRLIDAAASKIADDFFTAFETRLTLPTATADSLQAGAAANRQAG